MNDELATRFRRFGERECGTSPLYAALAEVVAGSPSLLAVAANAPDRAANLFLACVQRVLADNTGDPLAAYYPSFGGTRTPDAELARIFGEFVTTHENALVRRLLIGETQTNEPLRAAQLRPAFGWAQACFGRTLGLIEVGASAGLLLHADRYSYTYGFGDGTSLAAGSDSGVRLHMPVRGSATAKALRPFVAKDLRIASRVGLDLRPLRPDDPEAREWLRALVWPEHEERRARLDAALEIARRSPVRLRAGDATRILGDAVAMVGDSAVPCVFASNALAHFPAAARTRFVELIRELGAARDLLVILKENRAVGAGLFTDVPPRTPSGEAVEDLTAVVHQSGRERIFSLGTCGPHGAWLDWNPAPLASTG
jgi:hypothetical protein